MPQPPPNLTVRSAIRQHALDYAGRTRLLASNKQPRFTRVSPAFLDRVEAATRIYIESVIHSLPSKGKTIV